MLRNPSPRTEAMSRRHHDHLRVKARYARQRYDLYKARAHGRRRTSPQLMRELQRACEQAEALPRAAESQEPRARTTGDTTPDPKMTAQLAPRCTGAPAPEHSSPLVERVGCCPHRRRATGAHNAGLTPAPLRAAPTAESTNGVGPRPGQRLALRTPPQASIGVSGAHPDRTSSSP
jgi:hypothetical protein